MKIHADDLAAMRAAVAPLDTPTIRAAYASGDFPRASLCRDRDKRFRWDLLAASRFPVCDLYAYLNDVHIDTALRSIVPPLAH